MTNAAVIEVMLLRWSDNQNGRTVTLLLPDDGGEHPFKGLKCGPSNGERLAISVARIADDETQEPVEKPKEKREYSLPQRVAMVCNEPGFARFLCEQHSDLWFEVGGALDTTSDADIASECVRLHCNVSSRSEILPGTPAAAKWDELHGRYLGWQRGM